MNRDLLNVVEAASNEKAVSEEVIFDALETALEAATRKQYEDEIEIRVAIDRFTGDYETFRCYSVLAEDDIEIPSAELTLAEAKAIDENAEIGGIVEEKIENLPFGRIGAHLAKQVIIQKVREAEREKVYEEYIDLEGQVVHGTVKRLERGNVVIDLGGNVEGIIYKEDLIPRENTRQGERLRIFIKRVVRENRGHQIVLSRVAPELLKELFRVEVPEIASGTIEIKGAARDPGVRAKIAVYSEDPRIDAAGACIGMRASRVQNITNELSGERIDIVIWDEAPAEFVIKAIAPAEPTAIVVDEELQSMDLAFAEDRLPMAVGRGGQNVRLASELTGWRLNVMSEEEFAEKTGAEQERVARQFAEQLDVDEDIGMVLVENGYTTLDEIAYGDVDELYAIDAFDTESVDELRARASDVLLTQAISREEAIEASDANPIETLEGMDEHLLLQVKLNGIHTWDDLAELSVDELSEMTGIDEAESAELIIRAREPWFRDEGQGVDNE
ncbi:transcription termination factor NusA [Ostreibacterium oceani]|uniref:Transcription termination/antitermination protein NusA n=1 Tax=Ostreibacterium oceani TaxID=2654998 RepID=A0A6N7F224_9GAMM|nr:transcription termination factor NusA [Ostreibacterium oceani]MPV85916.1 transcription termination/antitermination protein NusA [Ostreibacterium oceani]